MIDKDTPTLLRTTLALTHSVGAVTGLNLSMPSAAYLRRTEDHIAQVARLSDAHHAMIAGMDRFAEGRMRGYDDKSTEVFVDMPDVSKAMIAFSPVIAKQNEEQTDERS